MTAATYRLTVKFAPPGVPHFNQDKGKWETSTWGHVWLEARKPGEALDAKPSFCAGWSTGESIFAKGGDNLGEHDWEYYKNGNGKTISSITVDIDKAQFDKLVPYRNLAAGGKIPGFSKRYGAGDNSCIDFSGKGLGFIGLADKNFDGSGLFWARPDKQVNAFLEQIAEHRRKGAALVVEHRGRSYTFEENERDVKKFWRTIDPYWYLAQDENQREQPYQYAQTDIAKPALRIEDMPQYAQNIYHQGKECFVDFCRDENIPYREEDLDRIGMSMAAAGYAQGLRGVSLIDVDERTREISIAHESPDLNEAMVNMDKAAVTPTAVSLNQIQQTAQRFENEEQQKQYAQSQSRGMSMA